MEGYNKKEFYIKDNYVMIRRLGDNLELYAKKELLSDGNIIIRYNYFENNEAIFPIPCYISCDSINALYSFVNNE